jgi:formylglycine-generating enzyme required for sulfatase activity
MKPRIWLYILAVLLALIGYGCGKSEPLPPTMPSPGEPWTRPKDDMVTVYVPTGEFEMGSAGGDTGEMPVHTVVVDGFWLDRTEVSNSQYMQCVAEETCTPPADDTSYTRKRYYGNNDYNDYPVVWVNWHQAQAYCEWVGARLPTEAEWEYAARGPEGRSFPWGEEIDGTRLNFCDLNCERNWANKSVDDQHDDTAPVGSYPEGASWIGALDMAGNVWEWVADWYAIDYYSVSPTQNPQGPDSGAAKVLRGGAWNYPEKYAHSASRIATYDGHMFGNVGFRCAAGIP